jgi:hypothetical protein
VAVRRDNGLEQDILLNSLNQHLLRETLKRDVENIVLNIVWEGQERCEVSELPSFHMHSRADRIKSMCAWMTSCF